MSGVCQHIYCSFYRFSNISVNIFVKIVFYCVITSDSLLKISLFYNKLYFIAIIADPPDVGQTSDVLDQTSDVHVLRQMSRYI
jgi:hypothetical protein